jgi:DNA polymerase III subunit delta'
MAKRKSAETKLTGGQETDGAPGVLHPRFTQALFGHSAAEETFLRAFRAGALHHAWLLTGEEGIGKATFAYRASRFLLSRDGEKSTEDAQADTLSVPASHPVARQIAAGAHPSLFVLANEAGAAGNSASIGVEAVRKLRAFLNLTSPGGWRAMIVDPANDLTIASANALLKAIEEPPPRTVFFLISHGTAAVMPTIRSRCIKLALHPLKPSDFQSAVLAGCASGELPLPDGDELGKLHAASAGSPGRALELIAGSLLPLADKVDRIVAGLPTVDYGLVHELIQSASGARNAANFSRLCDHIEARIEARARTELLDPAPSNARAAAWADLWHGLRERRVAMEALNLDKGAFLMTAFSDMEEVARRP